MVTIVRTEDDLRACLAIREAVFIREQNVAPEEELDEWDRLPPAGEVWPVHLLLRADDGTALATARLIPYSDDAGKVQRVAVLRHQRGRGFGAQVMAAAEQAIRERGKRRAVLDAQLHAEGFYRRLGYARVSDEVFLDAGIEHVRMAKLL